MWETIVGAIGIGALIELVAAFASRRSEGEAGGDAPAEEQSDAILRSIHVLHPYFGFTMRPGMTPAQSLPPCQIRRMCTGRADLDPRPQPRPRWLDLRANALGMWSEHPFPYRPQPGEIVIGMFGGSVASFFAMQGAAALAEHVGRIPEIGASRIVVLNFGIQGGKQPQQLAVLSYVLSRGQHLDIAINVDGINELLWATYNHRAHGVDYTFPSTHLLAPLKHLVHGGDAGVDGILALSASLASRVRADRLARLRSRMPSAALRALLGPLERHLRKRSLARLAEATGSGTSPDSDPMPFPAAGVPEPALAEYWRDCSAQFHRICLAHGILYLHVLQPTLAGSGHQPTEAEREFIPVDDPNLRIVADGYPRLAELAAELRAAGVQLAFADAVFKRIPHTVFSDHWGHLNQLGNEVLAEFIGLHLGRIVHEPAIAAVG